MLLKVINKCDILLAKNVAASRTTTKLLLDPASTLGSRVKIPFQIARTKCRQTFDVSCMTNKKWPQLLAESKMKRTPTKYFLDLDYRFRTNYKENLSETLKIHIFILQP